MPVSVVVGVDGSAESSAAADWAADEALRRGAVLRLVHAWPFLYLPLPTVPVDDVRRQADRVLHEAEARVRTGRAGLEVVAEQSSQPPVEALVAAADGAGVLVLGSRGLGAVAGFLVGSVGHQVLTRTTCPVVLVRGGAGPRAGGREVVVGVDPGEECGEVLAFGCEAAERLGLPLRAVHAWSLPAGPQYAAFEAGVDLAGETAAYAGEGLARAVRPWWEKYPRLEVVEEVVRGSAAQVLTERAEGAALLVLGRRVRTSPVGAHVGAVAHAVLHHAPCPVAVVPHA